MKKNRRKTLKKEIKRLSLLNAFLVLFLFLGMGYSLLNTNLNILGDVTIKEYLQPTLYNVLKTEAESGTYAKEYTGAHQDSITGVGDKKIYHWYAQTSSDGTAILDKNNVIFAEHCWQMIRTTDTGGVRMIYNGEADNNQCLNTRGNHVGYAERTTQALNTTYYYGTSYIYDKTNNVFSLEGTVTTGTIQTGQYTCMTTSPTGTCATLYLVDTLSSGTTYYVLPLNSNSNYSQFGTVQFNQSSNSPAYVGYMYNTVYPYERNYMTTTENIYASSSLSTSYWYAHSVAWASPIGSYYNLVNPYQISSTSDYPNLVGEYTYRSSIQNHTAQNVFYIAAVNNSTMYYITLSAGSNIADNNDIYTYGNSYTDNGNGTYTINNPATISRLDWYNNYSNIITGQYVCKNAINNTCSNIWRVVKTGQYSLVYTTRLYDIKYSKSFTYDGSKYILDNNNAVSFWNMYNKTDRDKLKNAHYTCWDSLGECTTVSYIYYNYTDTPYYINLTGGKNIESAFNEMFFDDNVNLKNSTIKTAVDAWYKHYLLGSYDNYLEDTIFCNDRSMRNINGWNPNGGDITEYLQFENDYLTGSLSCPNITDKFSINNNKAKLIYPIGLLPASDMVNLNMDIVRKTGETYWLLSPSRYVDYGAINRQINTTGRLNYTYNHISYGVRPAISLKPGTTYSSGTGTKDDPYIVE